MDLIDELQSNIIPGDGAMGTQLMEAGIPLERCFEELCVSQPDLVTDGVEGCVFRAGDISALTAALHRILDTPETAPEMGRRALERIKNWNFEEDVRGLRQAIAEVTRRIEH